ncbi:MAG: hypothetical protein FWF10_05440 [Clostridiales bacterium]|nr:hypothetical protein [Clostridiales bacterium]
MKKWIAIAIAMALVFALSACKTKGNNNPAANHPGGEPGYTNGSNNQAATSATGITRRATSYADAYDQSQKIRDLMERRVSEACDKYDATLPEGDMGGTSMILFMPLYSLDLAFTATFDEDKADMEETRLAYSYLGWEFRHPAPYHYSITIAGTDGTNYFYDSKFDPGSGSFRFVSSENGEAGNFYEFINLGGGEFAFQTRSERLYIRFNGDKLVSFSYTAKTGEDERYAHDRDSIYPNGSGTGASWAFSGSADSYGQVYILEGNTLKINALPFWGERIVLEFTGA